MGFQIIKPDTDYDFIGKRKYAYIISISLILIGLLSLGLKGGPKFGIDFAGGVIIQVKFEREVELPDLSSSLDETGLPALVVQRFGDRADHEFLLRTSAEDLTPSQVRETVENNLSQHFQDDHYTIQRLEMVGPRVGADLRENALEALFFAVLFIAIYISGRFEHKWFISAFMAAGLAGGVYILKLISIPLALLIFAAMVITIILSWYLRLNFALGAVLALIHDILITVGIFSLLNKEFDLSIVAALLTIIGYSLNDTIIVFDRIRENLRNKISSSLSKTINISINQTLGRTIVTSGTTLAVVLCLLFLGGGIIHDFAFALTVGIIVGTYSSIFVASPILLSFRPVVEEEGEEQEVLSPGRSKPKTA
ncbi:protein translocase subunit SecF [Desulfonatronovibrio hydrogenovorans]|uniref:protein translocase subunit SecF n=1 Tax=Desulfonatronovibrio hydrogenovorans TaxID=53245 RepID=UPI000490E987|nr:protein translocase subunit SecF [Desulfonatronovibrio hydrogenovorans]